MFARRVSAVLAIVAGLVLLASLVGSTIYGIAPELFDLITVASILLLFAGAAVALWRNRDIYLVMAWAWMAGLRIPALLRAPPPPPAYLSAHRNNPQEEAMLRHAWEYGLHYTQYVDWTWSIVAVAGLCLALVGEKFGRNPRSSGMET